MIQIPVHAGFCQHYSFSESPSFKINRDKHKYHFARINLSHHDLGTKQYFNYENVRFTCKHTVLSMYIQGTSTPSCIWNQILQDSIRAEWICRSTRYQV